MCRLSRVCALIVGGLLGTIALGIPAYASFKSSPTASTSLSSSTLNAPTNLHVTTSCEAKTATLTWTATSSTFATGYTVLDQVDGGATTTVKSGITSTTYTMSLVHLSHYVVAVKSSYLGWTSVPTSWSSSFSC